MERWREKTENAKKTEESCVKKSVYYEEGSEKQSKGKDCDFKSVHGGLVVCWNREGWKLEEALPTA